MKLPSAEVFGPGKQNRTLCEAACWQVETQFHREGGCIKYPRA